MEGKERIIEDTARLSSRIADIGEHVCSFT
jgi:hypothetical protein